MVTYAIDNTATMRATHAEEISTMTATTPDNALTKLVRAQLGNNIALTSLNQARLEDTNQTIGQVLLGIDEVAEHLRTLAVDNGCEWEGVDAAELYNPEQCRQWHDGLRYWGAEVWFQLY